MSRRSPRGVIAAAAVAAALSGCAPTLTVPPPRLYTPAEPQGAACLDELGRRGVAFEMTSERAAVGGCNLAGAVRVAQLLAPFDKSATMDCQMALLLDDFEINVVQMAAQRYFGRRVVLIRQLGAYSCRNVAGTHRLSEHAHGRAIDIAGFDLEGGLSISVKDHWSGAGARSRFLQEVAREACRIFSVVLTPRSNRAHLDHLHFDLAPQPLCEA